MNWVRGMTVILLASGCVERIALPEIEDDEGSFSVGDTTYLALGPVWDSGSQYGLLAPVEVAVSHARQVFVADTGLGKILVFNFSGARLDQTEEMFATLDLDSIGPDYVPVDIDVDGRLNVLIIDGGNKVVRWNQYWNLHDIDSVATEVVIRNAATGLEQRVSVNSPLLRSSDWELLLQGARFTHDPHLIDSLLYPHVFLDMAAPENDLADLYYSSVRTKFAALSRARLDDDFFYVADSAQNRLIKVRMRRNGIIKLGNEDGEILFTHVGRFDENSVEAGTGAGTLNKPSGLDVDELGNIYYTQFGQFVTVHSVAPIPVLGYPSNFELQEHDIMDGDWYAQPNDIAVDQDQLIYIANTNAREVLVFNGEGAFFKKAGVTTVTIDTAYWVFSGADSALVDTFFVRETRDQLVRPVSVAVDERGVIYVCDPAQSAVLRYTLSTRLDENLIDIDQ